MNKIDDLCFFLYCIRTNHQKILGILHMTTMVKIYKLSFFSFSLVILFGITMVIAQDGPLDGKVFVGQYLENHKKAVKEDKISFINGEFYSVAYGQRGFEKGMYVTRVEEDKIYFEAETVSPKRGKIEWRGFVHGDSIEVKYRWSKKGWLSDTVKDFSFNGILKQ
jgi:hypothetical protein